MASAADPPARTATATTDASTVSTVDDHVDNIDPEKSEAQQSANDLARQRSIQQAVDEGHDADIPSSTVQILPEVVESQRRRGYH